MRNTHFKQLTTFALLTTMALFSACGGSSSSDDKSDKGGNNNNNNNNNGGNHDEQIINSTRLNDTGITWGVTGTNKSDTCDATAHGQQDCASGRDSQTAFNRDSNGRAGFNFTKLDAAGKALKADATSWACVKDNVTKLVWEVKTTDGGTHDKKWRYYFYDVRYKDAQDANAGGDDNAHPGATPATSQTNANTTCGLADCTTEKMVAKANADGLCGITTWNMPSMQQLLSLVDYGFTKQKNVGGNMQDYTGMLDERYFPHAISSWSSTLAGYASGYIFNSATGKFEEKDRNDSVKLPVRLVHIPAN